MRSTPKGSSLLTVLVLLAVASLHAQPVLDFSAIHTKYHEQAAVILNSSCNVRIDVQSNGPVITSDHNLQILYLELKGLNQMTDQVSYDPHFYTVEELDACTWVPSVKGFTRQKVSEFLDVNEFDDVAFFDSRRLKEFKYPSVQSGAVTECNYTYKITDPVSMGGFSFSHAVPTLQSEYSVLVPDGTEIGYFQFGSETGIDYTVTRVGKSTLHSWKARELQGMKDFDFRPNMDHYRPHLYVYIKSYTLKGNVIKLLNGPDELYKYNYNYIKDLDYTPSGELVQVVDSIRKHSNTEEETVKEIFYWVQRHISYIAFEEGLGGVIPSPAEFVLDKRYGDCKGMANLLKAMLNYANIPASLCWIGTRNKGYTYQELPLPYCDDHMIAAYKRGEEYIFLDATSNEHQFGMPSIGIQGKQAMISVDADHYDLITVPFVPYTKNTLVDQIDVTVDNEDLHMKGQTAMDGFIRSELVERIRYAGAQHADEAWKDIIDRGNNKCKVDSYTVGNMDERDSLLRVDYELTLPAFVRHIGDEYFINLNLDETFKSLRPDTADRKCDVEFMHTISNVSTYYLKIPEGYQARKIPADLNIVQPKYEFHFTHKQENDVILVKKEFYLKEVVIPQDEIGTWLSDLSKVDKAFQQTIVLTKN